MLVRSIHGIDAADSKWEPRYSMGRDSFKIESSCWCDPRHGKGGKKGKGKGKKGKGKEEGAGFRGLLSIRWCR